MIILNCAVLYIFVLIFAMLAQMHCVCVLSTGSTFQSYPLKSKAFRVGLQFAISYGGMALFWDLLQHQISPMVENRADNRDDIY